MGTMVEELKINDTRFLLYSILRQLMKDEVLQAKVIRDFKEEKMQIMYDEAVNPNMCLEVMRKINFFRQELEKQKYLYLELPGLCFQIRKCENFYLVDQFEVVVRYLYYENRCRRLGEELFITPLDDDKDVADLIEQTDKMIEQLRNHKVYSLENIKGGESITFQLVNVVSEVI